MTIEKALNSIKGQILDYDLTSKGTILALIKSEKGNLSIRQAFRNIYGEYNGFTIIKILKGKGDDIAMLEFADLCETCR